MRQNRVVLLLLYCAVVFANIFLLSEIEVKVRQINCFSYETAFRNFRDHAVPQNVVEDFFEASGEDATMFCELLTMYFSTDNVVTDTDLLRADISLVKKYKSEEFDEICGYTYSVWNDLKKFPVGEIKDRPKAQVVYSDSWMQSRTFGGERGHEGCDIMATVNQRGIYPVLSMTDGVVEKIGWLRLGGYRIGIRSESGAYFYYTHLAEYAKEFEEGEPVKAGTLLGFMGDTGYSDVPGTTGNFDVHLHLGIYLNDMHGQEFSVNSYPMLRYIEEHEQ